MWTRKTPNTYTFHAMINFLTLKHTENAVEAWKLAWKQNKTSENRYAYSQYCQASKMEIKMSDVGRFFSRNTANWNYSLMILWVFLDLVTQRIQYDLKLRRVCELNWASTRFKVWQKWWHILLPWLVFLAALNLL